MSSIPSFPTLTIHHDRTWVYTLWDTIFAIVGPLLVTLPISLFQLYPAIPNISLLYLLVVLMLASTRGRYAAILASLIATLAFDFFLVEPFYTLSISRPEEWIALLVFLVDAFLTGQLAVLLRQRAKAARQQEQETRILYEMVRITATNDHLDRQLQTIAQAMLTVFTSWGIRRCTLLLPDATGLLHERAVAPFDGLSHPLSADEQTLALQVLREGHSIGLHETVETHRTALGAISRVVIRGPLLRSTTRIRFIPLKWGERIVGILLLRIERGPLSYAAGAHLTEEQERTDPHTTFFWTFLDQAASIIELARLRSETLQLEVLRHTDELRAALLSSVSHDLRTPLASIKAAASSLQQEDVEWDEKTRKIFAATIEREADRLNRLVGNLLDMSRIEGGAIKPEKDWYALSDLIEEVLQRMKPLLRERLVQMTLPSDLPLIEFDYVQMDQVLTNLIENAIRYTPADSPIDIRAQAQGRVLLLDIADRGPGIPEQDQERVFDKFYRVHQKRRGTSYPLGTGLGLAVCKGLVEANSGRIWAQGREGGGVVFTVELPLVLPKEELPGEI
jgi:two-component system sensor histidine kinase KdpD